MTFDEPHGLDNRREEVRLIAWYHKRGYAQESHQSSARVPPRHCGPGHAV